MRVAVLIYPWPRTRQNRDRLSLRNKATSSSYPRSVGYTTATLGLPPELRIAAPPGCSQASTIPRVPNPPSLWPSLLDPIVFGTSTGTGPDRGALLIQTRSECQTEHPVPRHPRDQVFGRESPSSEPVLTWMKRAANTRATAICI